MGACESNKSNRKMLKKTNRGKQPYCAPVKDYLKNNNVSNLGNTANTLSTIDLMSNNDFYKSNPSNLYKYKGTYYNKGEQVSLMTGSLHELQGNSLNGPTKYSKSKNIINNSLQNTCIDETDKESSSDVMEIIFDGKMDENMIQKSTDQTTINSYNEFIGKKEINFKKNKIDMYNSKTIEEARKKRDAIIEEYSDVADKAMECLDYGFESVMTVMALPERMRRFYRTTNYLERLNKEIKRRSNVIGVFPNVQSIIRIMGSVLLEQNDMYMAQNKISLTRKDFDELNNSSAKLIEIAKEQQRLLAA